MMADERDNRDQEHDEVIEAGLESFPASDPPSYNMPARHRFVPKTPQAPSAEELLARRRAEGETSPTASPSARPPESFAPGAWRFTAWVAIISASLLVAALLFR